MFVFIQLFLDVFSNSFTFLIHIYILNKCHLIKGWKKHQFLGKKSFWLLFASEPVFFRNTDILHITHNDILDMKWKV